MRTTKIVSVSLPPAMLRETERVAKKGGRTKSELFREALRRYLQEEKLREFQRYGQRQSRLLGIQPADVERLVEEYRTSR